MANRFAVDWWRMIWPVALVALVSVSCGTRVSRDEAAPAGVSDAPVNAVASPEAAALQGDGGTEAVASGSGGGAAPVALGRQAVTGTTARPVTAGAPKGALPERTDPGARATNSSSATAKDTTAPGTPGAPAPGDPILRSGHSPVRLASVGIYSGPMGTNTAGFLEGAQLWVRFINAKGGLDGHPVVLFVYDDGNDPARHRAQVQEAVETKGAIGFLMNSALLTGNASVDYLNQKRVPSIGLSGAEGWAYTSPMFFPQMSLDQFMAKIYVPSLASMVVPAGKTKLGTLICVEAPVCDNIDKTIASQAPTFGMKHVSRGRASVVQPDFTAECLAARNAGAEVLFVILDVNGVRRFSSSCSRQGYHPIYALISQAQADDMAKDPNLSGTVLTSTVFPYFQTGTPATEEYREALRGFGKDIQPGTGVSTGWAAGKLLQKAALRLPEPPTSAALLDGLWSIKNDTLGGLTMPLTFVKDQPPVGQSCWFNIGVRDKQWESPDRYALHCL